MTVSGATERSVLVVDDSAFMRKLIGEMVDAEPNFRVVGFARDGVEALSQIRELDPDIVTLDLEMPLMDGMRALEQIMADVPRPVIVLSAGGEQFGDATLRALELGALEFVRKPSGPISLDIGAVRLQLADALAAAVRVGRAVPPPGVPGAIVPHATDHSCACDPARHVVVIASSTGGPRALAEIIPALPRQLCAAVVIAQHLPRDFTHALAERLNKVSSIAVRLALPGNPIHAGNVYVARGGTNTVISRGSAAAAFEEGPESLGASPSADALFHSAARIFGAQVTGVVLTGMGRDGADGLSAVRRAGGRAIIQDQASCTIYGMPRAALKAAGADRVVALSDIANAIVTMVDEERKEWLTA